MQAAERDGRRRWLPGSRLGQLVIALNLVGLVILIVGVLVLNEFRQGLVQARTDSLRIQGEFMDELLTISATKGDPEPTLDAEMASQLLQVLSIPSSQRVRLIDRNDQVIFDSYLVADKVEVSTLPPARKRGEKPVRMPRLWPFDSRPGARPRRGRAWSARSGPSSPARPWSPACAPPPPASGWCRCRCRCGTSVRSSAC